MGLFHRFVTDEEVALIGCEAGGDGVATGRHAAPLTAGSPGVLHGARSYLMQDDDGQTLDTHSISAGLDYPGVGPEHAWMRDSGRAQYRGVSDIAAMEAFALLARTEGIICAIESAHAFAGALEWIKEQDHDDQVVVVEPQRPRRQGRRHGRALVRPRVSRLAELFARCRAENRAALIGYLPVGFPSYQESVDAMLAMVAGGVDAVEVGVPYTDPGMDGPVIQVAVDAALRAGSRVAHVFDAVRAVSAVAPAVVMGYWNPIEKYGPARFAADLKAAGGSGAITPDLIPEEATPWIEAAWPRTSTPSSSSRRPAPMSASPSSAGPTAASSTPPARWASPAPVRRSANRAQELVAAHPAAHRSAGLRRARREQRRPGSRGGCLRRRRHRRLGPRARAPARRRRRDRRAGTRPR